MKLDPITEYIIFKDTNKEGLNEFADIGAPVAAFLGGPAGLAAYVGVMAAAWIWAIWKVEQELKKTPRCTPIETQPEFDICRYEEYIKLFKKEIAMAKSKLPSCSKDKKPEKCKKALNKIITRAQKEISSREKSLVKWRQKKKEKDAKQKAKEAKKKQR
jgi:uncharacterized protein (DUF305 family)